MVTNPLDNVFIVSLTGLFFLSESKYAVHFRESDPFLNTFSCISSTSFASCENKICLSGSELPLLFSLQMTEGRLCQVQLLDDRKLELLVQV